MVLRGHGEEAMHDGQLYGGQRHAARPRRLHRVAPLCQVNPFVIIPQIIIELSYIFSFMNFLFRAQIFASDNVCSGSECCGTIVITHTILVSQDYECNCWEFIYFYPQLTDGRWYLLKILEPLNK